MCIFSGCVQECVSARVCVCVHASAAWDSCPLAISSFLHQSKTSEIENEKEAPLLLYMMQSDAHPNCKQRATNWTPPRSKASFFIKMSHMMASHEDITHANANIAARPAFFSPHSKAMSSYMFNSISLPLTFRNQQGRALLLKRKMS